MARREFMGTGVVFAVLVGAANLAAPGADYVYSEEDRTLTVTVDANATNTFDFANYGAYLTDNLVTNFIKQGKGGLVGASDIGSYLGDITVEAGTYTFTTNRALGKLAGENVCGSVYVKNGATLDSHPATTKNGAIWGWFNKRIVFEGDGVDGIGALVYTGEYSINRMVFSSNLVMTANAKIANRTSTATFYMSGGSWPMWLDMNGHTLTFEGPSQIAWGCWNIKNPGKIISNVAQLTIQNGNTHMNGSAANELVMNGGSTLGINLTSGTLPWTLNAGGLGIISVAQGGGNYNTTNLNYWAGPVLLGDRIVKVRLGNAYWFTFHGPLSGTGGLYAYNASGYRGGQLNLVNPGNSFTGGVGLDQSVLALWNDGALPADGAALAMTNSSVQLNSSATFSLPDLQVHGTGLVERGYGCWKTATKTGAGELVWKSCTSGDVLDVKAGTVSFLATRSSMAGLIESERRCYNGYAAVTAASVWNAVFTNIVTLSPEAYYKASHHIWSDPKDEGTDRYLVAYTGYLWNNEATNVTWSFAGAANTHLQVRLDKANVFYFTGTGNACTLHGTVSGVKPGPHHIDIRGYSSTTSGSFPTSSTLQTKKEGEYLNWPSGNFAVGFDPYGRASHNQTDYKKLIDPGDGSLLTWTLPEHVDSGVTEEPGTGKKVYYGVPNFNTMKFAAGTGMKSEYDSVSIPELEGLPAVTGVTNLLTITTAWTIPAADFVGGTALTTSGHLALGAGANITIADEDRAGRTSGDAAFTVATADGGIALPVDLTVSGATREWKLVLSADTKTLYARHIPRGTTIYLK